MLRNAVIDELNRILGSDASGVDLGRALSRPPTADLGDLAFGCFALAKQRRKPPAAIAEELAALVRPSGLIRGAKASGPYLNFEAEPQALLAAVCAEVEGGGLSRDPGPPARVMIEFSQPNTHKPFHVGHLRNVAIGDALVRLNRACGREVIAANYYGDYGIDVAKCLWWLRTHPELAAPEVDRTSFLGQAYIAANDVLDPKRVAPEERERNLTEVRAVLQALDQHEPEAWALYQQTRRWCLDEFADVYRWLGVSFDVAFYESEMEAPAARIVDQYLEQGVFRRSEGAIVCDLEPDEKTPALLRKSDGTSLYMTWDLALAKRKFDDFSIDWSLYVVGAEQRFHFRQLFLTLARMGYPRARDCRHVAYELVMLPTGKMSSRSGTAVPLWTLRRAVSDAVAARLDAADARVAPEAREETVRRIAIACLKYGMLSIGPNKTLTFSLEDWTNPEGDTGAYLLYGLARMRSILRKVGPTLDPSVVPEGFGALEERALLNHLLELPSAIRRAADGDDPSVVANWCYECARAFNAFYRSCPVLHAEPPLKASRLALVRATDRALTDALGLIGIEPVDAM